MKFSTARRDSKIVSVWHFAAPACSPASQLLQKHQHVMYFTPSGLPCEAAPITSAPLLWMCGHGHGWTFAIRKFVNSSVRPAPGLEEQRRREVEASVTIAAHCLAVQLHSDSGLVHSWPTYVAVHETETRQVLLAIPAVSVHMTEACEKHLQAWDHPLDDEASCTLPAHDAHTHLQAWLRSADTHAGSILSVRS